MTTWVPLEDLPWFGGEVPLAPGVRITGRTAEELRVEFQPDLEYWLAKEPGTAMHSLAVDIPNGLSLRAAEVVQCFLFSLWVARPTRAHATWRLEKDADHFTGARYFDQFQFNRTDVEDEVNLADFAVSAATLPALAGIYGVGRRLKTALVLSVRGCESIAWQVSLICHGAALEALMTYSTSSGITKRLSKCFACLTETDQAQREIAYQEFMQLYSFRSDLLHGRGFDYTDGDENLRKLSRMQRALRSVWSLILVDPALRVELEREDVGRKAYFQTLCAGFAPPAPAP